MSKAGDVSRALWHTTHKYWYITCLYHPKSRTTSKTKRLESRGYLNEEDADDERNLFRFAVDRDVASYWQQPSLRRKTGIISEVAKRA